MENMNDFMNRAAERTGFVREAHGTIDKEVSPVVIPFFGDKRHEFFLSAFLHSHKKRYTVIAGLPGRSGLFPNADEYWAVKDEGTATSIAKESLGWCNESAKAAHAEKQLAKFFDLMPAEELSSCYDFGLKSKFFDQYQFVTTNLPGVPSLKTDLMMRLPSNKKVLLIPNRTVLSFRRGAPIRTEASKEFYVDLAERLFAEGITPVVLQGYNTIDISPNAAGRYPVFSKLKALEELSVARSCDCVLDLFAGDSRLAIMARAPFLTVNERLTYENFKDYEVEDLAASQLPKRHIFSFATMIEGNEYGNVLDGVLVKLKDFLPQLDKNQLPSTSPASFVAPYMLVRERKMKKFGHRLFRLPKIEE